jgi:2-polyprenyl-3-methyl-5-hydroxy-6-metoxy-1,4-benzoquinol methylase
MYRRQLRPFHTAEELAKIYKKPHEHSGWLDHRYRVEISIGICRVLARSGGIIVDLSAGDGAIARGVARQAPGDYETYLGDFALNRAFQIQGPIEKTLDEAPPADLFICSETLEHVENPDTLLRRIRFKNDKLFLSTPVGEKATHNVEHYWGWDQEAIQEMLEYAGWRVVINSEMSMPGFEYTFQFWGCDQG